MNFRVILLVLVSALSLSGFSQSTLYFQSLDSLLAYAESNSISIKTGGHQALLAKWQRISAQVELINPKVQTNFNLTDNITLPVTFLPAEAFGGEPGTFKEVTTGQQYVGSLNIAPQIDIINPARWAKLKSAYVGEELVGVNNLLVKKALFESIAAAYFNILSLQQQIELTRMGLANADSLLKIVENKYTEGIVRKQDMNDATINTISLQDQLVALELSLSQQYDNIKVLCDIPENLTVVIRENVPFAPTKFRELKSDNRLSYQSALLATDLAIAEVKANYLMQLPTISLVFNEVLQQYSQESFFDPDARWINSRYFGLKLTLPFPDANRFVQGKIAKINKDISIENAEHILNQNLQENRQLLLDYEKTFSQFSSAKRIHDLKAENYQLALHQFEGDILPTDRLLVAFTDLITSRLVLCNTWANNQFAISRIEINNMVQ